VRRAFGFVRDEVLKTTGNKQEPFVYGSLGGEDVPLVPARPAPAAAAPASTRPSAQAEGPPRLRTRAADRQQERAQRFLAQYPDGFYASLAKLQLDKIAAEETRVAATEKARQAEQERARLAAEGAQKSQQAKAEADAKAAEQARIAAEKAKQVAQDQAAAAEQKRVAAESAAADKASAPAPADKDKAVNLAALDAGPPQADVTKSVQAELRRVGCLTGNADGNWNSSTQRSLTQFNRYAGTRLDTKVASVDTLDTIKLKSSRVCPLVCEHGFQADGDRCTKITCAEGSFLNDDNECEKRRAKKPVAARERPEPRRAPEARQVQESLREFISRVLKTPGRCRGIWWCRHVLFGPAAHCQERATVATRSAPSCRACALKSRLGRDDGRSGAPDASGVNACEPGPILLCMGLFSIFYIRAPSGVPPKGICSASRS
jgi:hypothetical protein